MDKIRILLADSQELMRDGLEAIFDSEENMIVVGAADTGMEAYRIMENLYPDVLIIDIQISEKEGFEAVKKIKKDYPDVVVIVLTNLDNDEYIARALSYGASSYLLKNVSGEKLIQTVRETLDGNLIMPRVTAAKLAARLKKLYEDTAMYENMQALGFSQREREIAKLLVLGLSNKQIAARLYISEGTAKNYVSTIYNKVGINDRTRAVIFLKEYIA